MLSYSLGLSMHFILSAGLGMYFRYMTKEDIGIEAQGKFVDAKGVNCASLEIVRAKKYYTQVF